MYSFICKLGAIEMSAPIFFLIEHKKWMNGVNIAATDEIQFRHFHVSDQTWIEGARGREEKWKYVLGRNIYKWAEWTSRVSPRSVVQTSLVVKSGQVTSFHFFFMFYFFWRVDRFAVGGQIVASGNCQSTAFGGCRTDDDSLQDLIIDSICKK